MKLKMTIIALIFLLLISVTCYGQEPGFKENKDARAYCESILGLLAAGQTKEAFDRIGGQWIFPLSEVQKAREQSEKEQMFLKERFGHVIGSQLVNEEKAAGVGLRYTYVIKFEKHLIRWQFLFYKPKDRWLLNTFKWDNAIDDLFVK